MPASQTLDFDLNLPEGEMGLPPPDPIPASSYFRWIEERMEWLQESGEFAKIMADANRRPVDAPFRLD